MSEQNSHPEQGTAGQVAAQIQQAIGMLPLAELHHVIQHITEAATLINSVVSETNSERLRLLPNILDAATAHAQRAGILLLDGTGKINQYLTGDNLSAEATSTVTVQKQAVATQQEIVASPKKPDYAAAERNLANARLDAETAKGTLQALQADKQLAKYLDTLHGLSPEALALLVQDHVPYAGKIMIQRFSNALWKLAHQAQAKRREDILDGEDLWVAGAMEVIRSCSVYEPRINLSTFVTQNARNAMLSEVWAQKYTVRIPPHMQKIITDIAQENSRRLLAQQKQMTDAELVERYGIVAGPPGKPGGQLTTGAVRQALLLSYGLGSIDSGGLVSTKGTEGSNPSLIKVHSPVFTPVHGETPADPADLTIARETVRDIHRLLATFPPKHAEWIRLRYGMHERGVHTPEAAAEALGYSESQMQRYEQETRRLLNRIKNQKLLQGHLIEGLTYEIARWDPPYTEEQET